MGLLQRVKTILEKHKEEIRYLFFGGLAFVVSVGSYAAFERLGFNELIANLFSWVLAVLFAYITNSLWVFDAKAADVRELAVQMASFFGGRILTLGIEEAILFVFVTLLRFPGLAVKVFAQIVVIVSNYFISKWFVFRKGRRQ